MRWGFWPYMIALVLIPLRGISQRADPATKAGVVCWQEGRNLTWNDFQARTRPTPSQIDSLPGHFLGAFTEANALVYAYPELRTIVSVQFDKRKSWVNKTAYFDRKSALLHEQLHFDIAELTGRKIRQVLARCQAQSVDFRTPTVVAEIGCLYDDESDLQLLYDKEAGGGDNLKAQVRWQSAVKRELVRLSVYKSTAQDCIIP